MNILGISALSASGKDTFAKVLLDTNQWMQFAFADPLKRTLMDLYEWSPDILWGESEKRNIPDKRYPLPNKPGEYLTPRLALQRLGDFGREMFSDTWVDRVIRDAKQVIENDRLIYVPWKGVLDIYSINDGLSIIFNNKSGILFSDIRYANEISAVRKLGGKVIRISRPGHGSPKWEHSSETSQLEIPDSEFDLLFKNDYNLPKDKEVFVKDILEKINKLFGG